MRALLLLAHGSRVESSNEAVAALVNSLRPKLEHHGFASINYAFLELASPAIPEGIEALVKENATQIVVLPYFLAPGTHVIDDIPQLIEAAKTDYPDVVFTVMKHLGAVEGIVDLILENASAIPASG